MKDNQNILPRKILSSYRKHRLPLNRKKPVCLAPLKSLRFLPDGNITVCCHNNSFSLGKYPEVRIIDAWNSDKIKYLRKKLSKADFSAGCSECVFSFLNGNYGSVNPLLYENYAENSKSPVMLDFKIATECNLECIMCSEYSSSAIRNKSVGFFEKSNSLYGDGFISEIESLIPHLKEARFSGGEPFLNNIYYKIWEQIININPECRITIQTNGTILNERIKNLLNRGNFYLNISIDAVKPEAYRNIRLNGEIQQVLSNLGYFSEYAAIHKRILGITACAMKDNIPDLPDIMQLANKHNANLWYSEVRFPFVNALWVMHSGELDKAIRFLRENLPQNVAEVNRHNASVYNDMVARLEFLRMEAVQRESGKGLIPASTLKEELRIKFGYNISENPRVWARIENILNSFENSLVIDISVLITEAYEAGFMYSHLGRINDNALQQNFRHLLQ